MNDTIPFIKTVSPDAAHMVLRDALLETMKIHGANLPADELLAIASILVGQLIAVQDQRLMSPEQSMELVMRNIERGNADMIESLLMAPGGHA